MVHNGIMKASLIQTDARDDKAANLRQAEDLIARAVAEDRPDLVVLPEMFPYMGESVEGKRAAAEALPSGEAYALLCGMARRHGIYVHGGSLYEKADAGIFNTTVVFDREGREIARYRKIHRFDVTTPDGRTYRESALIEGGREIVTYEADGLRVGCTICYDLRFPELYQALMRKGADVIVVPAAFTLMTGKDHWEVLLRARAIETQTYVLACGRIGPFGDGKMTYGHSMAVDPWGHVVARMSDGVGFVTARIDPEYLAKVRAGIPVAAHKVL